MKRRLILTVTVLILVSVRQGNAKIVLNSFTSYVIANQGILPNINYSRQLPDGRYSPARHSASDPALIGSNAFDEGYIIILSHNVARDTEPAQNLISITVTATAVGLTGLEVESTCITSRDGTILGVTPGTGTITLQRGRAIPLQTTDPYGGMGYFFIAIRISDTCEDGVSSTFTAGNVIISPPVTGDAPSPTITTAALTCELRVGDILPVENNNRAISALEYPEYNQWYPGEMIRPRYDRTPQGYDYAPLESTKSHRVPQVIPWETRTAVLAIACAQRNVTWNGTSTPNIQTPPEYLSAIRLTCTDTGKSDFDPNYFFRDSTSTRPGITLWRDTNGNGIWEPTDTQIPVSFQQGGLWQQKAGLREWSLVMFTTETIEPLRDGLYDYFVVIEVRSDTSSPYDNLMGSDYRIWIDRGDIVFGPIAYPYTYTGILQTKTIYNNIYLDDIAPSWVDPSSVNDTPDMTDNILPVMGLDIAGGPTQATAGELFTFPNLILQDVRVNLLAIDDFDPNTDLQPLRSDNYSGVSLWQDNKTTGNIGSFDVSDTFIPCNFTGWVFDGQVNDPVHGWVNQWHTTLTTLALAPGTARILPEDDAYHNSANRGDDFFLCLRVRDNIGYGAKFAVNIPSSGVWLTQGKSAGNSNGRTGSQIRSNITAVITSLVNPGNTGIGPSSSPVPVLKVELKDNSSNKGPRLEGITVEFYPRGDFHLDDLASFDPVFPRFNESTRWWEVTNFNPTDLTRCGVVIYRSNTSGTAPDYSQPVLISRFRQPSYPGVPMAYQLEFQSPVSLPVTLFVVIRTSSTFSPGDSFDVGVVGWGGNQSAWNSWGSQALAIIDNSSIRTNAYVRQQTGTFNPASSGTIVTTNSSSYENVTITWSNMTGINPASFINYEIYRDGILITTITDFYTTSYTDNLGPNDGTTHNYTVRMNYYQGGVATFLESNATSGQAYGFPDNMAPTLLNLVPGKTSVWVQFRDNSPHNEPLNPFRATSFLLRRTRLLDDTFVESTIPAHIALSDITYTYTDSPLLPGNWYKYEIWAQRQVGSGTAISRPVTSTTQTILEEGTGPGGGGGCFIATAAFGSSLAPAVKILRQFRDMFLLHSVFGQRLVAWYYRWSPEAAAYLETHPLGKQPVRLALYPLVVIAWLLVKNFFWPLVLLVAFFSLLREFSRHYNCYKK